MLNRSALALGLVVSIIFSFVLALQPALANVVETNGNSYSMQVPSYSVVTGDWYSPGTQKQISLDGKTITFTYESEGLAYYNTNLHLFYYVLTKPDGTQEVLKQYQWDERNEKSSVEIKDPYYSSGTRTHSFSNVKLPEQNFEIDISERGHYKVELKQLSIPRIILDKNSKAEYNLNDLLNNWTTENIRASRNSYSYNCWVGGGWACITYTPDASWSNNEMCSLESPTGNITLKELSWSKSQHCGWELGENSRGLPNCKSSEAGSTDCTAIGMSYSKNSVCKFPYSTSSSWSSGSETNNYCFIERSQFKQIKISDLGSSAIWVSEFDVKDPLVITDIKACGDLECETNPSMRPNEKIYFSIETSEPVDNSQLKVFGSFKSESFEDLDLQANDGGKAEFSNGILKLSSSTSPYGYGKAISKNSYSSPASVKWTGKIISGERSTYSDVDLLLGGDLWSGGIGFHWNSWYGYMDAIGINAAKSLGDFSGSAHEFRLDVSENRIVWYIDSKEVFSQDILSPPGGRVFTSAYGAWPSNIGPRTVGSFELSDFSIIGKQYQMFQPVSGKNIFEFAPAEEGDYNLNFFVSTNDGRDDSYSVPISVSSSNSIPILETSAAINPFSQSRGNVDNKNTGSSDRNNSIPKNILPLLGGAAVVGAAAAGGLYLIRNRTKAGRFISGIKSGFTDYGLAQIEKTRKFFEFLQWEKEGGWVKKWEAEERARQEYQAQMAREKAERENQMQIKSFAMGIAADSKNKQTQWATNQANEAIEMLNSGKGDPGWFRERMKYLAEQSGNAALALQLRDIAFQVKGERIGDEEAEDNKNVEKISASEIEFIESGDIVNTPSAYYTADDKNYTDFEKEDYTAVQQSEPPSLSGAFLGALKALMIYGGNEFAFLGSVVDKLSKGDLLGAASALVSHSFDFASALLKVTLNHGKEIIGAAIIGLAAGVAIVLTGGLDSPLVIPLMTVGIGIVGMQIFNYYVPMLSRLNGDASFKDIFEGNVSKEALSDYNQISEMLLTDTIILTAAIAAGGVGGRIGRFKITETPTGEKIIIDETTGKPVRPSEFLNVAKQELQNIGIDITKLSDENILKLYTTLKSGKSGTAGAEHELALIADLQAKGIEIVDAQPKFKLPGGKSETNPDVLVRENGLLVVKDAKSTDPSNFVKYDRNLNDWIKEQIISDLDKFSKSREVDPRAMSVNKYEIVLTREAAEYVMPNGKTFAQYLDDYIKAFYNYKFEVTVSYI